MRRSCSARPTHPRARARRAGACAATSAARCSAAIDVGARRARARRPARPRGSGRVSTRLALGRLLDPQALLLLGQVGVLGGQESHLDRPALGLERLVLLRPSSAWRSREPSWRLTSSITSRTRRRFWRVASSLAERLGALELVPRDPGRLLHEDPPVERLRGEDVGQALLFHERVGLRVHAGAEEEVVDVLQPAHRSC